MAEAATVEATGQLTIDALARETGMTVRNVRAHQSRGLLPPPEVRGRTGYYGPDHVARIELIKALQADGFSLELIGRMVKDRPTSADAAALRFTRALHEPFADEEPQIVSAQELAERYGPENADLLEKAVRLGTLRPLGDGRFEEVSPRLARAAEELVALGVPIATSLEVASRLRRSADEAAKTFVRLFVEYVWKPFVEDGSPAERWHEVGDTLERLRPLAAESLGAMLGIAMDDAVERALGRELERLRKA